MYNSKKIEIFKRLTRYINIGTKIVMSVTMIIIFIKFATIFSFLISIILLLGPALYRLNLLTKKLGIKKLQTL